RRRLDVGRAEDCRHDGNPVGTGGNDLGYRVCRDAGDRNYRSRRRTTVEDAHDAGETVRPDRRIGIVLAAGRVDAADAEVVDELDRGGLRLRLGMDGETDDRIVAQQTARILDRHVLLAEMDAVRAGSHRHVDT